MIFERQITAAVTLEPIKTKPETLTLNKSRKITLGIETFFGELERTIKILGNDGTPILDDDGQFILAQ